MKKKLFLRSAVMWLLLMLFALPAGANNYVTSFYVYKTADNISSYYSFQKDGKYYYILCGSVNGKTTPINFNMGNSGDNIYIAYTTGSAKDAVTGIYISNQGTENVQPYPSMGNYKLAECQDGTNNGNLNKGTKSSAPNLFLYYTKEGNDKAGTKLMTKITAEILSEDASFNMMSGYDYVEERSFYAQSQSDNTIYANLNNGAGGNQIYLMYESETLKTNNLTNYKILEHLASQNLMVGESYKIPLYNKNSTAPIYYSSSDEGVATVDDNGNVASIGEGDAVITIYQIENGSMMWKELEEKVHVYPSKTQLVENKYWYPISTADEFAKYAGRSDLNCKLVNDITLPNSITWKEKTNKLIFLGNGYKIKNVKSPLFASNYGDISNLTIEIADNGASVDKDYYGLVCRSNSSSISGVQVKGKLDAGGFSKVGGICGVTYAAISNCLSSVNITKGNEYVGGICGYAELDSKKNSFTISNCSNTGNISGNKYVAGIAGYLNGIVTEWFYSHPLTTVGTAVNNSNNIGRIIGDSNLSGIANVYIYKYQFNPGTGMRDYTVVLSSVSNSYSLWDSVYDSDGNLVTQTNGMQYEDYYSGKVCWLLNGKSNADDVEWVQNLSSPVDYYPLLKIFNSTGHLAVHGGYETGKCKFILTNEDKLLNSELDPNPTHEYANGICSNCNDYQGPNLDESDNTYKIGNAGNLLWLCGQADSPLAKLINNINLATVCSKDLGSWTPLDFSGTLDGKGFIIKGLYVSGDENLGLFATNSGTIKNLWVQGNVAGNTTVGMICGTNSGTITGCVSGNNNQDNVIGLQYVGGICGSNTGTIENCCNQTQLNSYNFSTSSYGRAGGIAANNSGTISNCLNIGKVNSSKYNLWSFGNKPTNSFAYSSSEDADFKNYTVLSKLGKGWCQAKGKITTLVPTAHHKPVYPNFIYGDGEDWKCERLELSDDFEVPFPLKAKKATYTRSANNSQWGTLCLPFAYKNFNATNKNAKLYDRFEFYENPGIFEFYVEKMKSDRTQVNAGYPVFVKTTDGSLTISADTGADENGYYDIVTETTVNKFYGDKLIGSLKDVTINIYDLDGADNLFGSFFVYYFSKDKFWQAQGKFHLKPYRAYFTSDKDAFDLVNPNAKSFSISEVDYITGVKSVSGDSDSSVEAIYDINGRKLDTLKQGVNIVRTANGTTKKVIKK